MLVKEVIKSGNASLEPALTYRLVLHRTATVHSKIIVVIDRESIAINLDETIITS